MIKANDLKIFDKYIFKLVAMATLVGIVAFIVVWISPETLFKVINRVSSGELTVNQGLKWLFFEIPIILGKAIPVGLLLGTLVITNMLSMNFELVIFRSIGISFWRLAKPIIVLSGLFAIFCYFAYMTFIPYSSLKVEEIKSGPKTAQDIQWSYLEKDENNNPKQLIIIFSSALYNLRYINVFQIAPDTHETEDVAMKKIIFATADEFNGDKYTIKNMKVYELLPSGIYNKIYTQKEMTILTGKSAINAKKLYDSYGTNADNMTQKQLLEHLKLLKEEKISDEYNSHLNNLYQRFAQTLSCIVFAICGLILGWSRPRENKFLGFTIGALIIFSYYLIIPFINMLAEKSILPPLVTAFLPLTVITVAMFFYAKYKDLF